MLSPDRHEAPVNASDRSPEPASASEQGIIARIRMGDAAAFEMIFREHYDHLFRFVYSYVHAEDAAEELVQDVFAIVWERRAEWEVRTTVRAYLYAAARNRALNDLRHRQVVRRAAVAWSAEDDESGADVPGMGEPPARPDEQMDTAVAHDALERAVRELPERYRRVINLRLEHGLSHPMIAEVLGIPLRTVETQVGRAMRILRERLGGAGRER